MARLREPSEPVRQQALQHAVPPPPSPLRSAHRSLGRFSWGSEILGQDGSSAVDLLAMIGSIHALEEGRQHREFL